MWSSEASAPKVPPTLAQGTQYDSIDLELISYFFFLVDAAKGQIRNLIG